MAIPSVKNYLSLAEALAGQFGSDARIAQTDRLAGGDINKAYGLHLVNGAHVFMKANEKAMAGLFTAEAQGLSALASTHTVRTPKILCTGTDPGEQVGYSFLMLDFLENTGTAPDYWETLAHDMAALHRADTASFVKNGSYGFLHDNFIGTTAQQNTARSSWVDFFRIFRLEPQFRRADHYFDGAMRAKVTKLLEHLESYICEPEKPALVHGDFWSGNVVPGPDGKAWIIDPAVYVANREVDIAMSQLFGGFPESFYAAYNEVYPLESGYEERRDFYNLYQILNHLNLFGESYLDPVCEIVGEYIR